jgi:hypothetical protein
LPDKRGFSLFGWIRGQGGQDEPEEPASPAAFEEPAPPRERPRLDQDAEDDLEIPPFLRRQMGPRGG